MVSRNRTNNGNNLHKPAEVDKISHKLFDEINVKIIKELVNHPNISSTEIASRFRIPLSTIQRRRARLEESVLKKTYDLDLKEIGWRTADLMVSVDKGKAEETAEKLLQSNKDNVIFASLRIGHPKVDIMAQVFYRDSQELHNLTESVKAMPYVSYVEWAEVVKVVGSNFSGMLDKVFSPTSD